MDMLRNLLILNLCIFCTFYFLTIWFFRIVGLFCNYFLKIFHFGNSFIWILFYPLVGWLKFWNCLSLLRGNILLLCKGAAEGWGFFYYLRFKNPPPQAVPLLSKRRTNRKNPQPKLWIFLFWNINYFLLFFSAFSSFLVSFLSALAAFFSSFLSVGLKYS